MTLKYTTDAGKGKEVQKEIRVPFNPPLAGYDDVKPRLLEMKVDAEKALGMVRILTLTHGNILDTNIWQAKNPQITTFELGPDAWKSGLLFVTIVYLTVSPPFDSPTYGPLFFPGTSARAALPANAMAWTWGVFAVLHGAESLYTYSLCRRHKTSFFNTVSGSRASRGSE